jgi:iron complex outermembrane receptor protein
MASPLDLRRGLCATLVLLAWLGPIAVQGTEDRGGKVEIGSVDIESLLDLSVEAVTRRSERASEAPAAVFVLTADDLRRHGFRSLDEVLGSVPGFFSYPGNGSPQVGVRGMGILGDTTTRLLVLVDGHPLGNASGVNLGRGFPVPLGAIQRVEVIRGPVGSVYGPSAFFGVVNLVTSGAAPGGEVWAGGEAAQGALRAGEVSATWQGAGGSVEGLVSVDAYSARGGDWTFPELAAVAPPRGELAGMDFGDAVNGYVRARWREVGAAAACGHSFNGLPATPLVDRRNALEGLTCFAELSWKGAVSDELTLESRASYDGVELRVGRLTPEPPAGIGLFQDKGHDRWIAGELRADWRPFPLVRLDAGATAQLHWLFQHSFAEAVPALSVTLHEEYGALNTWLLGELKLGAGVTLHGGLTFFAHSLFGDRLTPKAAAVWQPTPEDTVKAIWSMGFRPPTFVEAMFTDGIAFLANPDLEPETVSSSELVYEHRFGGIASASASVFWNQYRDLVRYETVPDPGLGRPPDPSNPADFRQIAQNAGTLRLLGGEVAVTLRWGDWLQAYGGVSVQRVDEAARPNSPWVTANLALSTRALWRPLLLSLRGAGTAARAKDLGALLPGQRTDVPAAVSLDALAALDVAAVRGLQVELSLVNALDGRNASPAAAISAPVSEMPQAARTLRADVRWRF